MQKDLDDAAKKLQEVTIEQGKLQQAAEDVRPLCDDFEQKVNCWAADIHIVRALECDPICCLAMLITGLDHH